MTFLRNVSIKRKHVIAATLASVATLATAGLTLLACKQEVAHSQTDPNLAVASGWPFALATLFGLLAAGVTGIPLSTRCPALAKGLSDLLKVINLVLTKKDYSARAAKSGDDDLDRLIEGFNSMLAGIQERDAALQACHRELESRLQGRIQEFDRSLALFNATLDSTADGILVMELGGRVSGHNAQYASLWKLPADLLQKGSGKDLLAFIAAQVKQPDEFLKRTINALESSPETETFAVIELKDGRTFEECIKPKRLNGKCVGIVVNTRDITERKQAETAVRESELLFRSIMDNSREIIFVKDRQCRFVYMNPAGCRMSGKPLEKLVGHSKSDFHPDPVEARQFMIDDCRVMESSLVETIEEELGGADGTKHVFLTTKVARRDSQGNIIGLIGVAHDITDRKRVEAELTYERNLLRALMETSEDQIYFKDRQSRFTRSSKAQVRKFKLNAVEDMIGKTDFDYFTEEHARPAFEDEQRIIRTGEPIIGQTEKETHRDGHVTWALTNKMPLRNAQGEIVGTFGISKDITAIKEAEAKLEAVHRQLVAASREAGMAEVATSVLHNVGNVLNSVNVSTTLILDSLRNSKLHNLTRLAAMLREHQDNLADFFASDPKGRHLPEYLARLTEHLGKQETELIKEVESTRQHIEHIKDIVAMQQSYARVSGVVEKVTVTDLVEDALRLNSGALVRHEVQVIRDYPAQPIEINVERQKVLQILVNLIRNAKYACDDTERKDKCLTVRVRGDNRRMQIIVMDNGIGIPAENLNRIFNHGFTTRKKGHGFGLHSGALAARKLGGTLSVQSEGHGKGASFTLDLPLEPPQAHE